MTHSDDLLEFRACVRYTREIFSQTAITPYRRRELAPSPEVISNAQLNEFIKHNVESAYHHCGTCRMGTDEESVTLPDGRVRGVDQLRVVDASVMPQATAGDLNAPTLGIGGAYVGPHSGSSSSSRHRCPRLAASDWAVSQRTSTIDRDYSGDRESLREALLVNARSGAFEVK